MAVRPLRGITNIVSGTGLADMDAAKAGDATSKTLPSAPMTERAAVGSHIQPLDSLE